MTAAGVGADADAESATDSFASWDVVEIECDSASFWRRAVWYALRLDKLKRRLAAQDTVLRLLAERREQLNEQFATVLRVRTELEDGAWEAGAER